MTTPPRPASTSRSTPPGGRPPPKAGKRQVLMRRVSSTRAGVWSHEQLRSRGTPVTLPDSTISKHVEPTPAFAEATALVDRLLANVELVVRGKHDQIRLVLCALLCRGHVLFEDV